VPLVVDDSMSTFANHDFLPFADMLVSSLTKSFQGEGRAMGGALVLNPASPFYAVFGAALAADEPTLFAEDAAVIAEGAVDFIARTRRTNRSAEALAGHLAAHPLIETVYYPKLVTPEAYGQARRPEGGWGAMLSFVPKDAARVSPALYDALAADKGPGFGLNTTLVCPYTMLAHYHELDWAESCGVSRHLIRVSVGLEEASTLLARFDAALASIG
jgi:cystathionine gamma-synthase